MKSQVEVTDYLKEIANPINGEGIDLLKAIKSKVHGLLDFKPYNDQTAEDERKIRWKRTADQILRDGYVYDGKACTDLVVSFLGLAKAKDLEAKFVKLRNEKRVHSVVEVKLPDGWYMYDVASKSGEPSKGQFREGEELGGWYLWKKGRDSWDVGLGEFEDMQKIARGGPAKEI